MKTPKVLTSLYQLFFFNKKLSPLWLIVRVYVGWQWLSAGYEKVISPAWVGGSAGGALTGFVNGALSKTAGAHPDVSSWYAWFLSHAVLPNVFVWSHVVAFGEVLVGLGLIFGLFTYLAAFFGAFMNMNYLFAGTVSINPLLLLLSIFIMLAYRTAGFIGLDYYWKRKSQS